MILRYLSSTNLQEAVGGDLISRLEVILPGLLPDDFDPTTIYQKDTLLKILNSFSPSQRFRDKEFRHTLLNSLPPDVLKEICKAVGVRSSISYMARSFVDIILRIGLSFFLSVCMPWEALKLL